MKGENFPHQCKSPELQLWLGNLAFHKLLLSPESQAASSTPGLWDTSVSPGPQAQGHILGAPGSPCLDPAVIPPRSHQALPGSQLTHTNSHLNSALIPQIPALTSTAPTLFPPWSHRHCALIQLSSHHDLYNAFLHFISP